MKLINDEGYYTGPELQWNVEDVEVACERIGLSLPESDYERILIASFEDNDWVMERMQQAIQENIKYMMDNGELPNVEQGI
jgi:hypothetical protein